MNDVTLCASLSPILVVLSCRSQIGALYFILYSQEDTMLTVQFVSIYTAQIVLSNKLECIELPNGLVFFLDRVVLCSVSVHQKL